MFLKQNTDLLNVFRFWSIKITTQCINIQNSAVSSRFASLCYQQLDINASVQFTYDPIDEIARSKFHKISSTTQLSLFWFSSLRTTRYKALSSPV